MQSATSTRFDFKGVKASFELGDGVILRWQSRSFNSSR